MPQFVPYLLRLGHISSAKLDAAARCFPPEDLQRTSGELTLDTSLSAVERGVAMDEGSETGQGHWILGMGRSCVLHLSPSMKCYAVWGTRNAMFPCPAFPEENPQPERPNPIPKRPCQRIPFPRSPFPEESHFPEDSIPRPLMFLPKIADSRVLADPDSSDSQDVTLLRADSASPFDPDAPNHLPAPPTTFV